MIWQSTLLTSRPESSSYGILDRLFTPEFVGLGIGRGLSPRCPLVDEFGFVEADDGPGEGVIGRIIDGEDRKRDTGVG